MMFSFPWKALVASAVLVTAGAHAPAQTNHEHGAGLQDTVEMPPMHAQMMQRRTTASDQPTLPGQDAFGAVQEIVRILEADPGTDWSKVDLEALRQHLIDMNEVTLNADTAVKHVEGGLEIAVTGSDRTLAAIRRMIPAHAQEINGFQGWTVKVSSLPDGELLTVTAAEAKETQHIGGLGFIGIMTSGSHHQSHHLMIAKGESRKTSTPVD